MAGRGANPSFAIQKQIRDNCKGVQNLMDDIYHWSEDMAKEEKARDHLRKNPTGGKSAGNRDAKVAAPPIRGRTVLPPVEANKSGASAKRSKDTEKNSSESSASTSSSSASTLELARDTTSLPKYYKNWGKYNVEEELEKLEEPKTKKEDDFDVEKFVKQRRTTAARPNVKVAVRSAAHATTAVEFATAKKEEANRLFGKARFKEAEVAYGVALTYLRGEDVAERELQTVLHSNIAACMLKQNDYTGTIDQSSRALQVTEDHVKSLFRRGSAYTQQCQWKKAAADYRRALQLDPNDAKCRTELAYVERMLEEALAKARAHAKSVMQDTNRKPVLQQLRMQIADKSEAKLTWDESDNPQKATVAVKRRADNARSDEERNASGATSLFISSAGEQERRIDDNGKYIPKSVRMAASGATSGSKKRRAQTQAKGDTHDAATVLSSASNSSTQSTQADPQDDDSEVATSSASAPAKRAAARDAMRGNFYSFERDWNFAAKGSMQGNSMSGQCVAKRFQLLERTELFSDSFTTELLLEVVAVFEQIARDFSPTYSETATSESSTSTSKRDTTPVLFVSWEDYVKRKTAIVKKLESINRWELILQSLSTSEKQQLERACWSQKRPVAPPEAPRVSCRKIISTESTSTSTSSNTNTTNTGTTTTTSPSPSPASPESPWTQVNMRADSKDSADWVDVRKEPLDLGDLDDLD
ncbi:unnamed protein product [Amoebophrya sp. A25]|nr:unnamed protein product [Amoebophrya sp. A25]|eukprot:GSA25T00002252001.1